MCDKNRCGLILTFAALTYFVAFPEDAQSIATPVATFLSLTSSVSPWLYGVVAIGIVCSAIVKTCGARVGMDR